jgi:fido (protein-threonine AMPylation protein)
MLIMRRLNNKIAGKIRSCDVWVGGKKKIFTSQKLIEDDLKHLFDCMEASVNAHLSSKTAEDVTKHFHIEFEHIHPFTDGNGRIGRLILNKHRQSLGLPILIIHQGKEQYEYYKWFK